MKITLVLIFASTSLTTFAADSKVVCRSDYSAGGNIFENTRATKGAAANLNRQIELEKSRDELLKKLEDYQSKYPLGK